MLETFITINEKLKETEKNKNVKIIFAVESGSRSWGFHSSDSDFDCRFVYVNSLDFYISIFEKKDFIMCSNDKIFDINGWNLKKFLQHIVKSNAVTFEWLSSNDIYIKKDKEFQILKNLSEKFFNPISVSYHYLNIAKSFLEEIKDSNEIKIKKYFYILRPLACLRYIEQYKKAPFMEYKKNLNSIKIDQDYINEINSLMDIKNKVNEGFLIKKNEILLDYFCSEINLFEELLKEKKFVKYREYDEVDKCFKKIIEMMWSNGNS